MILKKSFHQKLDKVEKSATTSRVGRLLQHPIKYLYAILHREIVYRQTRQSIAVRANTFFGINMHVLLPAATDIYITQGKSHDSEIRLARFMINQLNEGDQVLDVGAHYGYFALLAATLVGPEGKVVAFEAAPKTHRILRQNSLLVENLTVVNKAASDAKGQITFYEFPNMYSEYNTLDPTQFEGEPWYQHYPPKPLDIETILLDEYLTDSNFNPHMIKIDVEGAELRVLKGMDRYLSDQAPVIAMEYLSESRGNKPHIMAQNWLHEKGYLPYAIAKTGEPELLQNVTKYLSDSGLESDNILFIKK
jgi:FkbM family methyltransferase